MKKPLPNRCPAIRFRNALFASAVLIVVGLSGGCAERDIPSQPTGQPVLPWMDPFDRDAMLAAMPYHRPADLSQTNYALLLVVQNFLETGLAVTLEVNGQDIERRYVAGLTQEIFSVTDDVVLQTEAALGISSIGVDARLENRPCPFVVRLKNYVTEDGYVIQDSCSVLAPLDSFESMTFDPESDLLDTSHLPDAHHVCPGAFAIVIRKSHVDFVELDREFVPVNEVPVQWNQSQDVPADEPRGDSPDSAYERQYTGWTYHPETITALTRLNMDWLLLRPEEDGGVTPVLTIAPEEVSFAPGETVASVLVTNTGGGELEVTDVLAVKPWITVFPTSGGEGQYVIQVSRAGLSTGDYEGHVVFTSNGGQATLTVTMEVP